MLSEGAIVAEKYQLLRVIGEGAMGQVWAAENKLTEKQVAMKFMAPVDDAVDEPALRERFLREARACGKLNHHNVVQVFDVGEASDGSPFMVMELLRGQTLDALLVRMGRLRTPIALAIAYGLLQGLGAVHRAGILHRDLKPANIFIHQREGERGPVVKVTDFGLSRNLSTESTLTVTGQAMGTPSYMSPEQARGDSDIDARTDIWAIGVILYEMLSGQVPFPGESAYSIMEAILQKPPVPIATHLPEIDPRLSEVITRCLQKNTKSRYESCEGLLKDLESILPRLGDKSAQYMSEVSSELGGLSRSTAESSESSGELTREVNRRDDASVQSTRPVASTRPTGASTKRLWLAVPLGLAAAAVGVWAVSAATRSTRPGSSVALSSGPPPPQDSSPASAPPSPGQGQGTLSRPMPTTVVSTPQPSAAMLSEGPAPSVRSTQALAPDPTAAAGKRPAALPTKQRRAPPQSQAKPEKSSSGDWLDKKR